jgi:hypothetical protein
MPFDEHRNIEDESDGILARALGGSLQSATFRLVLYIIVLSALVALIAALVGR